MAYQQRNKAKNSLMFNAIFSVIMFTLWITLCKLITLLKLHPVLDVVLVIAAFWLVYYFMFLIILRMNIFVLIISEFFPFNHNRSGEETLFISKILNGQKKHTIRVNYLLWKKRSEKIKRGEAMLSLRSWISRPYFSSQYTHPITVQCNVQKLQILGGKIYIDDKLNDVTLEEIANNDGLSLADFKKWFGKKLYKGDPFAIIQFTDFAY